MQLPRSLSVLGSPTTIEQILGASAEYIGGDTDDWPEPHRENIQRVFRCAEARLGQDGLGKPGVVPPRVLKYILRNAPFCADALEAEYLGGVLASSKSASPCDDRGASLVATLGRLSTYQLRMHYALYALAQRQLQGRTDLYLGMRKDRLDHACFFAELGGLKADMQLDGLNDEDALEVITNAVTGLVHETLIEDRQYASGDQNELLLWCESGPLQQRDESCEDFAMGDGVVYTISGAGMELFCAAHGLRCKPERTFVNPGGAGFALPGIASLKTSVRPMRQA